MSKKCDEKVQVAVRCRPMTESERSCRVRRVVDCNAKAREVNVVTSSNGLGIVSQQTKAYSFDKVFGPNASQLDVYSNVVEGQLQDVLSGYNCTVLAYGQTGTGKTFTMEGERTLDRDYSWDTDPRAGIIPRALSQLFDHLEGAGCEFSVRVSLLEIYNEDIYDLLSPGNGMVKMKIYEDNNRKGSVVVSGLTEVLIRHKSDVYEILQKGAAKRRTAATDLNEFSSRSHSVFSVTVHTKDISTNEMEEEELIKIGKLNLVDLAGSENIGRSGAVDKRAREAGSINQSLLTLGRCITALVDRAPHVPYRESKLTRLLQDSLGGTTKTSIIATISPGNDNLEETLSTLDYASRAKNIHNKPRVNQKLTKRALIKEYDEEIQRLQREVLAAREKNGVYLDPKQYQEMTEQIESLTATLQQRVEELEKYQKMFSDTSKELEQKNEQLNTLKDELSETQLKLSQQCFMKEAHIEHGNQVAERANELLETADILADDIGKVHDKVQRVTDANEHNLGAAGAFSVKLKSDLELLSDGTRAMLHESENNLKSILQSHEEFKERQEENVLFIKTRIMQFTNVMKQAYQTNCDKIQQVLNRVADLHESHRSIIDKHQDEMNSILETSAAEMELKCEGIASDLLSLLEKQQTAFDFQRNQLRIEAERVKAHEDEVLRRAKTIRMKQDQATAFGQNTLNEMMEKIQQQMKESVAATMSSWKEACSTNCDSLEAIEQSVANTNQAIEQSTNERILHLNELQEQSTNTLQQAADSSRASRSSNEVTHENLRQCLRSLDSETASNRDAARDEWTLSLESSNADFQAQTDGSVNLNAECAEEQSRFDEFTVGRFECILEGAGELSKNISVAKDSVQGAAKNIAMDVEEYFDAKLLRVLPTGETPARKEYVYTRSIPERPDEEVILRNFEEQMKLAELEEESDDLDVDSEEDNAETESLQSEDTGCEPDLNQSITIPTVGGRPFFTQRKGSKTRMPKVHTSNAVNTRPASRLPLRPTQNTGY